MNGNSGSLYMSPDFTLSSAADKLCESEHFIYPHFIFPCIKLWTSLQTCPWAECSTQELVIVAGVTLMAHVQFAQLNTGPWFPASLFVPGSACWAVPAGRCLPAPLGQPVHSCVQLSHHRWRKLHLLSHSPACSVIHIHTLDVDDYKWHEYLDLTISECISVYTCTGQLGQENLSPFM